MLIVVVVVVVEVEVGRRKVRGEVGRNAAVETRPRRRNANAERRTTKEEKLMINNVLER